MKMAFNEFKALLEEVSSFSEQDMEEAYTILVMDTLPVLLDYAVERNCMSDMLCDRIQDFFEEYLSEGDIADDAYLMLLDQLGLTNETCERLDQDELRMWLREMSYSIRNLPYDILLCYIDGTHREEKEVYGFCRVLTAVAAETGLGYKEIIEGLENYLPGLIKYGWMSAIALVRSITDWCRMLNCPCRNLLALRGPELDALEMLVDEEAAGRMYKEIYSKKTESGQSYEEIIRTL